MSAAGGKHDRPRPRLEILRGGRAEHDGAGADWQSFCDRIGWQQLTEPALPDDYEDRLVAQLFGPADDKLVSLEVERTRRLGMTPLALAAGEGQPVVVGEPQGLGRSGRGWQIVAVAVVAILGIGAAWLAWRGGEAPPAANTVPTPAPERVLPPVTPAPEQEAQPPLPEPGPPAPDPGVRLVERPQVSPAPAPRARRPDRRVRGVAQVAQPVAGPRPGGDGPVRRPVAGYRISPEREPTTRPLPLVSRPSGLWLPVETGSRPTIRLASQPAGGRAPTWHHLAMADGRTGAQSMALVDLLELDRRLSEAL